MSTADEPLKVIIVSSDVKLLHEISWMLSAVGYEVACTKSMDENALWRRYGDFDFLIFDTRGQHPATDSTLTFESDNPVYRIFLYDSKSESDISPWFDLGANDGLRLPLSRGELLVRIRTGARYLEFERRLKSASVRDDLLDCYTKRGFLKKLAQVASHQPSALTHGSLLVTAIDWFEGILRKNGLTSSNRLVSSAARTIARHAQDDAIVCYLGDGRFATLLLNRNISQSRIVAEAIAEEFSRRDSQRDSLSIPTLTTGIVTWQAGESSIQLLERGIEAYMLARQSGGDCVMDYNEFAADYSRWQDEMRTGNPFSEVVAQDIMEPFPASLLCDSHRDSIVISLQRACVPVCPVVDADNRLVGVASADANKEKISEAKIGESPTSLPIRQPETILDTASFAEIYESFSNNGCAALVVVTKDDLPLGYVTFRNFLSLIEPINKETFSRNGAPIDDSRYLLVGALTDEEQVE